LSEPSLCGESSRSLDFVGEGATIDSTAAGDTATGEAPATIGVFRFSWAN
jgi:hypothetical protein